MAEGRGDVIRRKLGASQAEAQARLEEGRAGPDRSWRLALARAARDKIKLAMDVPKCTLDRMNLSEILELAPERGLIAVLEGPKQALGVLMLSPDVLAGMIEAQTTGVVTAAPAPERRPTRTDAAMAAGLIDSALEELERGVKDLADAVWAMGYRYASFLEDIRPLGLLLEDLPYKVMRAEVTLAFGAKMGSVFMALPAEPRRSGAVPQDEARATAQAAAFATGFSAHVMLAASELDGVLSRISLPLSQVLDLEVGQVLVLNGASLDRISLEAGDGRKLWEGRLGQNRGLRALRLSEEVAAHATSPGAIRPATAPAEMPALPAPLLKAAG